MVREHLQNNPQVSARRNGLGLPSATFNRITRLDLRWHPYRIRIRHELKDGDYVRRRNFCEWFSNQKRNPRFLANVVIGDEAAFCMNGEVNSHNVRQCAPRGAPPDFNYERRDERSKITVWMGICGNGALLGLFSSLVRPTQTVRGAMNIRELKIDNAGSSKTRCQYISTGRSFLEFDCFNNYLKLVLVTYKYFCWPKRYAFCYR